MDDDAQRTRSRKERMGAVIEGVLAEAQQKMIREREIRMGAAADAAGAAQTITAAPAFAPPTPTPATDGKRADAAAEEIKTPDDAAAPVSPRGATIVARSSLSTTAAVTTIGAGAPSVQVTATAVSRLEVAVASPAAAAAETPVAVSAAKSESAAGAAVDVSSSPSAPSVSGVDWDRVEVGLIATALRESALRFMSNSAGTGKPDDLTVLIAKIKKRQQQQQ